MKQVRAWPMFLAGFLLFVIAMVFLVALIDAKSSAQGDEWMALMLNCGGTLVNDGDNTLHSTAEAAKAEADRRLATGQFDIAYVEQRDGQFYRLRWVKSTGPCYEGLFRDWSDDF